MGAEEALDYIDTVMDEHDLRPGQTIDTLLKTIESESESDDSDESDDGD